MPHHNPSLRPANGDDYDGLPRFPHPGSGGAAWTAVQEMPRPAAWYMSVVRLS